MAPPIHVIGIGADGPAGLCPVVAERIQQADFLAGGDRHLGQLTAARGERFVLKNNLARLVEELRKRVATQCCVVLASGDPLFYGIGVYLSQALGPEALRVEPAVSSMQLAFARAGVPWQDAALASIHGRDLRATLLPLLGRRRIGLFTQDGDSPAAVARFFLQRGLDDYEAVVGENLGAADERISAWSTVADLAERHFAPLNYLVLRRNGPAEGFAEMERYRALVPGVPDDVFRRPEEGPEVMTRQEVRSVLLGKLSGPTEPGDTIWDVGTGLGTVAVEVAVLRPHVEVVAVERNPIRATFAHANRERFGAYNVRVIEGAAPGALENESERPRTVFLGGSGERLPDILDLVGDRLREGGRLLGNFVTLEHLMLMLDRLRAWRWPFAVTEIHVARSDTLAGLTGLKPHRSVFLVEADKPAGAEAARLLQSATQSGRGNG
jgi:precorrin-6Y C5,15-methyltransferase (decarboxylating)